MLETLTFILIILALEANLFASEVRESSIDLDPKCYMSPTPRNSSVPSEPPEFETSDYLEQRYPGGIDNPINGCKEYLGEGVPYSIISFDMKKNNLDKD